MKRFIDYSEPKESAPLFVKRGPIAGEIYLKGFADGYHNRPRIIQGTKRAQCIYATGYKAGTESAALTKKSPA